MIVNRCFVRERGTHIYGIHFLMQQLLNVILNYNIYGGIKNELKIPW